MSNGDNCMRGTGHAGSTGRTATRQQAASTVDPQRLGDTWRPQEHRSILLFAKVVNNRGTVVGGADTSLPNPSDSCFDPFGNGAPDCFVEHAFQWRDDVLTDLGALGALPGVNFSRAFWINARGLIVGGSANGLIDPLTHQPAQHAVLWKDGNIIDLGTLGGHQSLAIAINNQDQVVGAALNTVPESPDFCLAALFPAFDCATQTRAFLWQNGVMHDLGGRTAA